MPYPQPIRRIVYEEIRTPMTDERWILLALACLDQAGLTIRQQHDVADTINLPDDVRQDYFSDLEVP